MGPGPEGRDRPVNRRYVGHSPSDIASTDTCEFFFTAGSDTSIFNHNITGQGIVQNFTGHDTRRVSAVDVDPGESEAVNTPAISHGLHQATLEITDGMALAIVLAGKWVGPVADGLSQPTAINIRTLPIAAIQRVVRITADFVQGLDIGYLDR